MVDLGLEVTLDDIFLYYGYHLRVSGGFLPKLISTSNEKRYIKKRRKKKRLLTAWVREPRPEFGQEMSYGRSLER